MNAARVPGPGYAELSARLRGSRSSWLPRYFPAGKVERGVFYLGNQHGDEGWSLPVPLNGSKPKLTDFGAGDWHGDDLDLLAAGLGVDLPTASIEALAILGLGDGGTSAWRRPPIRPAVAPEPVAKHRDDIRRTSAWALWQRCQPIEPGSVAATYLMGRECRLPPADGDLRWTDRLDHPDGGYWPALVGLVMDARTVAPLSLHRTWLLPDGSGKAPLGKRTRLVWPGLPLAGGVIRLWPDDAVTMGLLVGEGIETCLTAALGFQPVWSCMTAGNLAAFPVLEGIDCLTVVVDHDAPHERTGRQPGIEAGRACIARWLAAGREARPYLPETVGHDLNDEARKS